MRYLRIAFTLFQFSFTVAIIIITMYIFRPFNKQIRRAWASWQMQLLGAKLEIVGEIDESADMLMINHQSIMDIIIFEHLSNRNIAWIAKKEIADLFFYGHILKAPKMIVVERESKSSLMKLIKDSKNRLDDNRQLAIFPEGTRTDGQKLRKFKAGSKIIAQKLNLKVQAAVIVGSIDVFDSKNLIQKSGTVKVILLPSVVAQKNTTWFEDTETLMRETLENEIKLKEI